MKFPSIIGIFVPIFVCCDGCHREPVDVPIAMPAQDLAHIVVKYTTIYKTQFQRTHNKAANMITVGFGNLTDEEIETISGDLVIYDDNGQETSRTPLTLKMSTDDLAISGRLLPQFDGTGSTGIFQEESPHMGFDIKSATCYRDPKNFKDLGHLFSLVTRQDNAKIEGMIDQDTTLLNLSDPSTGASLIHVAAASDNVKLLDFLISRGVDINRRGSMVGTPVLMALDTGASDAALDLIGRGADISSAKFQPTAIEDAAQFCNGKVIDALVKKGCDPNDLPGKRADPLEIAARSGNEDSAKALIQDGANVNFEDNDHTPPLFTAVQTDDPPMVQFFLDHGADINEPSSSDGSTPLMMAAGWTNGDMIKFLISKGANVDARDHDGHTALDISNEAQNESTQKALEAANAQP